MPSSSRSPQAPSTKSHSLLRKSTDESPSFKTTSTSVPSEVRTSQSTNSLSPRSNESNHPEEDDVISDDDKTPEEIASAELCANRRRGYDPNSSIDENNTSFHSGVGSLVSSTPSLERAIKKLDSAGCVPKGPTHCYTNPHLRRLSSRGCTAVYS